MNIRAKQLGLKDTRFGNPHVHHMSGDTIISEDSINQNVSSQHKNYRKFGERGSLVEHQ
jgi:D-alanyl-D-alanine carboxypeptidase